MDIYIVSNDIPKRILLQRHTKMREIQIWLKIRRTCSELLKSF